MKTRCTTITAVLAFLWVWAPLNAARAIEFTPGELKRLSEGELVLRTLPLSRKEGFYGGAAFIVVNAPVDAIWTFLKDWKAFPKAFPRTVAVDEVVRQGAQSVIRMQLGYKILSISYYLNVTRDWNKKTVSFTLAKERSHDILESRGYWRLFPQKDNRTLVSYMIAVTVPRGIVAFLGEKTEIDLERGLIGMPKYLRHYLESQERTPQQVANPQCDHHPAHVGGDG